MNKKVKFFLSLMVILLIFSIAINVYFLFKIKKIELERDYFFERQNYYKNESQLNYAMAEDFRNNIQYLEDRNWWMNKEKQDLQAQVDHLTEYRDEINQRYENTLEELTSSYEQINELEKYKLRVDQSLVRENAQKLLGQYKKVTQPIFLRYIGVTSPFESPSSMDVWDIARDSFSWLSENYKYCGDKGFKIGESTFSLQYFSPDELLYDDNARCGDCDDYAMLFAGLMLSAGAPEKNIYVTCGSVGKGGGHCWNEIVIGGKTYVIDPVCSGKKEILNIFGLTYQVDKMQFPQTPSHVVCMNNYNRKFRFNTQGYFSVPNYK